MSHATLSAANAANRAARTAVIAATSVGVSNEDARAHLESAIALCEDAAKIARKHGHTWAGEEAEARRSHAIYLLNHV